jgi:hypothetical protein
VIRCKTKKRKKTISKSFILSYKSKRKDYFILPKAFFRDIIKSFKTGFSNFVSGAIWFRQTAKPIQEQSSSNT